MKLSAPIYHLKRKARILSREEGISLHEALDRTAVAEGFRGWSELAAKAAEENPVEKLYRQLLPGDMLLIAARPSQGKTLLSLELAVEAMKGGNRSVFFSLEYTDKDCRERFAALGVDPGQFSGQFEFDGSDEISADHIVRTLALAPVGTLAVIDYLQLLDQKRENPSLMLQVQTLKSFAKTHGIIFAFISQVDRSYDIDKKAIPDLTDIRLPNPLDLSLFNRTCFLGKKEMLFE